MGYLDLVREHKMISSPGELASKLVAVVGPRYSDGPYRVTDEGISEIACVLEKLPFVAVAIPRLVVESNDFRGKGIKVKVNPNAYEQAFNAKLILRDGVIYGKVYKSVGDIKESDRKILFNHDRNRVDPTPFYGPILKTLLSLNMADEGVQAMFAIQLWKVNNFFSRGK